MSIVPVVRACNFALYSLILLMSWRRGAAEKCLRAVVVCLMTFGQFRLDFNTVAASDWCKVVQSHFDNQNWCLRPKANLRPEHR
jgi:hypothetical protein